MSLINTEIADFNSNVYQNGEFKTVSKSDVMGKWSVFFFYPADFTFVCPTELRDLADLYPQFQELGVEVYGVSTDTHFVHKAWVEFDPLLANVTYPMIADPCHTLSTAFDVYTEGAGLAERGTFIVNPEGIIVGMEISAGNVGRNAAELLRRVQASQFVHEHGNELCPARWTPGAETIKI